MKKRVKSYVILLEYLLLVVFLLGTTIVTIGRLISSGTLIFDDNIETYITDVYPKKNAFINLNGEIRKCMGQHEMNGVTKLNNGYLQVNSPYISDDELKGYADNVVLLNNYLQSKGIPLVYVNPPITNSKYDNLLPAGSEDYANDNVDRLLSFLQVSGVETIDIREQMYIDHIDHYQMMYKTDHHWNAEAGFYAYTIIDDYIQDKTNSYVDERIADISNYDLVSSEQCFLGANGRRTGIYYAGVDDFSVLIPKFEMEFQDADGNIGTFQDILVDTSYMNIIDYENNSMYENVYDNVWNDCVNINPVNNTKILIISDSFSLNVMPYLIMEYGQVQFWRNANSSQLTKEYIDYYNPDVVIMLYYPKRSMEELDAYNFDSFR